MLQAGYTKVAIQIGSALKFECKFWVNHCLPDQEQVTPAYICEASNDAFDEKYLKVNDYFLKGWGRFFHPLNFTKQTNKKKYIYIYIAVLFGYYIAFTLIVLKTKCQKYSLFAAAILQHVFSMIP